MTKIFLASSVHLVAKDIAKKIGGAKNKKLLYIYTASEREKIEPWQRDSRKALIKAGFNVIDYTITGKTKGAIKKDVQKVDVIYFGGGNTFYLLQQIQLTQSASVFRDAVKAGKIYIGSSAGSILAGPDIYPTRGVDEIKEAKKIKGYKGLNLVDFIVFPHWGSKYFKNSYLKKLIPQDYNADNKLIILNDYQYMQVEGDWYRMVDIRHKI